MSEVWIRNPATCIRECAELLVPNLVWARGLARKARIDPQKHVELHYPHAIQYRILMVGEQGTAELRRGYSMDRPYAVYPTWEYGVQMIWDLEDMLREQRLPDGIWPDEQGVEGQEHRVVIIRPPNADTPAGKAFISTLAELQFEYPKAIIHYHGTYSYRVAFGSGLRSADIEPTVDAAKGKVRLGSGRLIKYEEAPQYLMWINLLGMQSSDLAVARNRTIFNIKSAQWAAENFTKEDVFLSRPSRNVPTVPDYTAVNPKKPQAKLIHRNRPLRGDKFICDQCSLAPTCKYHRDGGVCVIPDSETSGLARYFKTRDSNLIIDGLGRLMEKKLERAETGLAAEKVEGELDPEVTKILKDLFDSGVKLAKLVDPGLNGSAAKVGILINGGSAQITGNTENAIVSAVIAELEAEGIPRADIDAQMVAQYIANKQRGAIEVTAGDS